MIVIYPSLCDKISMTLRCPAIVLTLEFNKRLINLTFVMIS